MIKVRRIEGRNLTGEINQLKNVNWKHIQTRAMFPEQYSISNCKSQRCKQRTVNKNRGRK